MNDEAAPVSLVQLVLGVPVPGRPPVHARRLSGPRRARRRRRDRSRHESHRGLPGLHPGAGPRPPLGGLEPRFPRAVHGAPDPAALCVGRRAGYLSHGDHQSHAPAPGWPRAARGADRSAPDIRGVRDGARARRGATELVRPAGRLSTRGVARLAEARRRHRPPAAADASRRRRDRGDARGHAAASRPPALPGDHHRAARPAGAGPGAQVDRAAAIAPGPAEAISDGGDRLAGTRKYQPGGVALASTVGDSEEFVSLRDYRSGDPMRRIHWKSYARVGRPVVKEYLDEFFVRHALVLDTFTTHLGDPVFEDAVSVAASVAISMPTQESLLDLMFVGPEAYCFTAGRGVAHTEQLLEVLACVGPCQDKPFRSLHHAVIDRHDSLSGCVCVLLTWDDARQELVRQLEALGTPTRVLVVGEPGTLDRLPGDVHRLEVGRIAEGLACL